MNIDFEKIKSDIVAAGKDVGAKAKEVSNTAKIKLDIRTKEEFLQNQYAELGKAYYEAHKDDEDTTERENLNSIREALEELEALKNELLDVQGAVVCPNCGEKQVNADNYCKNCGAQLHV